jgi:hypothetical protein
MAKPPSKRPQSIENPGPGEVQRFLEKRQAIRRFVAQQPRLLFAVDATASRQPTWDMACQLQAEMFTAAAPIAALSLQLCYYRGLGEFRASRWLSDSATLGELMSTVNCRAGQTQIARVLRHGLAELERGPLRALVFVGDAVEETPAQLFDLAGQCRLRQLPLFLFQEGNDSAVRATLQRMAGLSGGAWAHFDSGSAAHLRDLLGAVARFAAGGRKALQSDTSSGARLLLSQLGD